MHVMASRRLANAGTPTQATRSRRTTCDICRERKVRCDKDQPMCERCRRLNLRCTYTPVSDSRNVTQTLSDLQERLAKAEETISDMAPASVPSPSRFTHYTPALLSLEGPDSPSSSSFLGLDDPSLGFFPNIEETYLSQDFIGSQALNADNINAKATMPVSLLQLSDLGASEKGGLKMPFLPPIQLQSISKLKQPNTTPVTSIPSYDTQTPSLSPIDANSASMLSINGSPVGQNMISLLHQKYFESTRLELNSINPDHFFHLLVENPVRHQVNALSYAIAISGASLGDDLADLKPLFYGFARQYLELAEQLEDGTSFLTLESLQALLIILRYDFSEAKCVERAWMTHARAMRLAKLLHMDTIDAGQVPIEADGLYVPQKSSSSFAEMDERRRTFWFAFSIDFFISALTDSLPTWQASEILTYLPSSLEAEREGPSDGIFLEDEIAQPSSNTLSNFKPLIIATALGNKALRHIKLSTEQMSFLVYDFWTRHYRLDKALLVQLALYPLPRKDTPQTEYMMLLVTHLTLLGVSILIHMRAFERAAEAGFPESVTTRSRLRFETLAMKISETCQQGGESSYLKLNGRNYLSMYLMWPICLAAKAQLLSIKNLDQNVDASSTRHTSEWSLRASLRVLESVLKSFGVTTDSCSETLEEIRLMLENNGDSSPSSWYDMFM